MIQSDLRAKVSAEIAWVRRVSKVSEVLIEKNILIIAHTYDFIIDVLFFLKLFQIPCKLSKG